MALLRDGVSIREGINSPSATLSFLDDRYDEEMSAAAAASSKQEKVAHLELALEFALRAREVRRSCL